MDMKPDYTIENTVLGYVVMEELKSYVMEVFTENVRLCRVVKRVCGLEPFDTGLRWSFVTSAGQGAG